VADPISLRYGRRVVLKQLDNDCLLDGQLHPMIRQRLERIRELPVKSVANLLGVERIDGVAQLVWEFVPGTPLAELQTDDWPRLAREVVLAIESLHAAGIVHGAIHGRNVLLDENGEIRLTNVSPLLYDDPQQDAQDAIAMLEQLVPGDEASAEISRALAEAAAGGMSLTELYARLADHDPPPQSQAPDIVEPMIRRRMIVAAIIVLLVGAGIAFALHRYATGAD
jgi:serine/threonine protein kinase